MITAGRLSGIARGLNEAPRHGAEKDEPEGSRYIMISETLANQWAEFLEETSKKLRELQ